MALVLDGDNGIVGVLVTNTDGDVIFDTNTLFVDAVENKVGIGTITPIRQLHLASSVPSIRLEDTDVSGAYNDIVHLSTGELSIRVDHGNVQSNSSLSFLIDAGERMRINSSGNVGIGMSSPDMPLTVQANSGANAISMRGRSDDYSELYGTSNDGSTKYAFLQTHSAQTKLYTLASTPLLFGTNNTERMRIDSSGVVRIGGQTGTLKLGNDANYFADIEWEYNNNELAFSTNSGANFTFNSGGTERMRIDSSGNLLVGKTGGGLATSGHTLFSNGQIDSSVDGAYVAKFNRKSSDGTIIELRKDTTSIVGSIGVKDSTNAYIGSGAAGFAFAGSGPAITPYNTTANNYTDNTVDLGNSFNRFKDIYTSGGVYLGGTGSANKLDDYEEGTWTPTVTAASGSINAFGGVHGTYTKIGREVSLHFQFGVTDIGSASGNLIVSNLPFGKETSILTYYLGIHRARSGTSSISELTSSGTLQLYGTTPINSTYLGSIVYTTS